MKEFLIVYSSRTGNTEKVAYAMQKTAPERCDIARVEDSPSSDGYSVVLVGYWVDKGEPDKAMQKFLPTLRDKKVVLFQTLGAEAYSEHGINSLANAGRYLDISCKVVGTLSIRGAIDPKLIEAIIQKPDGHAHAPTDERKARWKEASTHPDAEDLEGTQTYFKKFLAFYDKFYR